MGLSSRRNYLTPSLPEDRSALPDREQVRDLPVLIVDDNTTNRRILYEVLSYGGMRPTTAKSGQAALAALTHPWGLGTPFPLVHSSSKRAGLIYGDLYARPAQLFCPFLMKPAPLAKEGAQRHEPRSTCEVAESGLLLSKLLSTPPLCRIAHRHAKTRSVYKMKRSHLLMSHRVDWVPSD
jgi:CheY-like chemotaxis protein